MKARYKVDGLFLFLLFNKRYRQPFPDFIVSIATNWIMKKLHLYSLLFFVFVCFGLNAQVINNVFPATISAGTGQEIIISGNGFGPRGINGVLTYYDVNGIQKPLNSTLSYHIKKWQNDTIIFIAPTDMANYISAGSLANNIVVQENSSGLSIQLPEQVFVEYNLIGKDYGAGEDSVVASLINTAGSKGYVFELNTGIPFNSDTSFAIEDAINQWRCATQAGIYLSNTHTTTNAAAEDGQNVILFADLGNDEPYKVYHYYVSCDGGESSYLKEVDIVFNSNIGGGASFIFDYLSATNFGEYDFPTTALQAIGKVLQVGNTVGVAGDPMEKELLEDGFVNDKTRRTLIQSNIDAGSIVVQKSISKQTCLQSVHVAYKLDLCTPLEIGFTASDDSLCVTNATYTFTDTSLGKPNFWRWDFGDGNKSSAQNPSHTYTTVGEYDVTLTVGREDDTLTVKKEKLVKVKKILTPSVAISIPSGGSSISICSIDTVRLSAQSILNPGDNPQFEWFLNSKSVLGPGSGFTSFEYKGDSTVRVTLQVTSSEQCAVPNTVGSNEILINLTDTVTPAISITADTLSICPGGRVRFSSTSSGGGPGPKYQWYRNGNIVAGQRARTFQSTTLANGDKITCLLVSNNSCATPDSVLSNELTVTVNPVVLPIVNLSSSDTSVCSSDLVVFTADTLNGGSPPRISWYRNGVIQGNTTDTLKLNNVQNGEIIRVEYKSSKLCSGHLTASDFLEMEVTQSKTLNASLSSSATRICAGEEVKFEVNASANISGKTYNWFKNGVAVGVTTNTWIVDNLTHLDEVYCEVDVPNQECINNRPLLTDTVVIDTLTKPDANAIVLVNENPSCFGDSVRFVADVQNAGIDPAMRWYRNHVPISGATNDTLFLSNLVQTEEIYVRVITNSSCLEPDTIFSDTVVVDVVPRKTTDVSISYDRPRICEGDNIRFDANPLNGGASPDLRWFANGIQVATGSTYETNTLIGSNTITVVLRSSDMCVTDSVVESTPVTLGVDTKKDFRVAMDPEFTEICEGEPLRYFAEVEQAGATTNFDWYLDGALVQANYGSVITLENITDASEVFVVANTSGTCFERLVDSSAVTSVVVNEALSVAVNISSGQVNDFCEGTLASFTASILPAATPVVYQWRINGAQVLGQTSSTFSTTELEDGDVVSCEVTITDPCSNAFNAISNEEIISVTPLVNMDVYIESPDMVVCQGQEIEFNAEAPLAGVNAQYEWYVNGVKQVDNQPRYAASNFDDNDDVYCEVFTDEECVFVDKVKSNILSVTVAERTNLSVDVVANKQTICDKDEIRFSATISGAPLSECVIFWKRNNFQIPAENGTTLNYDNASDGDVFVVNVSTDANCVFGSPVESTPFLVAVNPLPNVFLDIEDDVICANYYADTIVGGSPAGGRYSGPGVADNEFDPFGLTFGSYSITYTYQDPVTKCYNSATDDIIVDPCTSVEQIASEESFIVYPNPATSQLTIGFGTITEEKVRVALYDLSGKEVAVVYEGTVPFGSHVLNYNRGEGVKAGVYVLKLQSSSNNYFQKVIFE